MDLSLSNNDLVDSFISLYNLNDYHCNHVALARSIRHIYGYESKEVQRSYVKELKWTYHKHQKKPYLFERLASRLFLNKRATQIEVYDGRDIERRIKVKYGLEYCHHACYNLASLFRSAHCVCCGSRYYISKWFDPSELGVKTCSKECSSIVRICRDLNFRYLKKLISRRFFMARGSGQLNQFLSYLAGQQLIKRKKKNKGKFTWS